MLIRLVRQRLGLQEFEKGQHGKTQPGVQNNIGTMPFLTLRGVVQQLFETAAEVCRKVVNKVDNSARAAVF